MLARLATRQITRFSSAWSLGALNHVAIGKKCDHRPSLEKKSLEIGLC